MEEMPKPIDPEDTSSNADELAEKMRRQADLYEERAEQLRQAADSRDILLQETAFESQPLDEEGLESLSFGEQFTKQIELWEYLGILYREKEYDDRLGYRDITGQFREAPHLLDVMRQLSELIAPTDPNKMSPKARELSMSLLRAINNRHYGTLRLVPHGLPLSELVDIASAGNGATKMYPPFTYQDILYMGDRPDHNHIYYEPRALNETHHKGVTKEELIARDTVTPGYQVVLLQHYNTNPELPDGLPISEYLSLAEHNSSNDPKVDLKMRSGLTPEIWLADFLSYLHHHNELIDDYQSGMLPTLLVGSYLLHGEQSYGGEIKRDEVPVAFWDQKENRFKLSAISTAVSLPNLRCRYAINLSRVLTRYKHLQQSE